MTKYTQISPAIHLISQNIDRKKVKIDITFTSGGSWFENDGDYGKLHLVEHCIASRTKKMSFQQLKDYEFRQNIYLNAFTGRVTMGLDGSGHISDFDSLSSNLLEMAFEPTFEQTILDKEKEIVLREISQRRGDPSYQVYFDTVKQLYTPDSLEIKEPLGDAQMVATTTLEDFYRLHANSLRKSHVIICASGDFDESLLQDKIAAFLSNNSELSLHGDNRNRVDYTPQNTLQPFDFRPIVHPLGHDHVELSIFIPCLVNFENIPIRHIFRSLFLDHNGVLYDRLREELQLVYSLQSEFSFDTQHLQLYLSCEIKYVKQIVDEVKNILSNFDKYFKPERFEQFKDMITKKQDLAADVLGAETSFTENMLSTYGIPELYGSYTKRLEGVEVVEIDSLYQELCLSLNSLQVSAVSKDPKIQEIVL